MEIYYRTGNLGISDKGTDGKVVENHQCFYCRCDECQNHIISPEKNFKNVIYNIYIYDLTNNTLKTSLPLTDESYISSSLLQEINKSLTFHHLKWQH